MDRDRRVVDHDGALTAARRRFVATGRLSMDDVARDLHISRSTLYRVVGSRDRLLGDVLWQLARRTLDLAIEDVRACGLTGVDRLLQVARRFDAQVAAFGPLQRLLQEEPVAAFRVLFTTTGHVHERMVQTWAELLRRAVDAGELDGLPFDVEETAYVVVRIGETLLYGDMLAGVVPDGELTERLRRTVLGAVPGHDESGPGPSSR